MRRLLVVWVIACLGALAQPSRAEMPPGIRLVGHLDTPGIAEEVALQGELAYVADQLGGLRIVDVGQPAAPREIGSLATPDLVESVVLSGTLAFLAGYSAGLLVVDVADPQQPRLVGSYDTPGWARGLARLGATVYVADREAGLIEVDVADPTHPRFAQGHGVAGWARRVRLMDGLAYVAGGQEGLQIVALQRPEVAGGLCDTPGWARDVAVAGTVAFVADAWAGITVVDCANLEQPIVLASYATPGETFALDLHGERAYVANGPRGLRVLEVGDPSAIRPVAAWEGGADVRGVVRADGWVFVAGGNEGLWILSEAQQFVHLPLVQCDAQATTKEVERSDE